MLTICITFMYLQQFIHEAARESYTYSIVLVMEKSDVLDSFIYTLYQKFIL